MCGQSRAYWLRQCLREGWVVDGAPCYRRDVLPLMASVPENRGTGVFCWTGGSTGFLGQFLFIDDSAPPIVLGDRLTSLP
jgi:hypothetical protein